MAITARMIVIPRTRRPRHTLPRDGAEPAAGAQAPTSRCRSRLGIAGCHVGGVHSAETNDVEALDEDQHKVVALSVLLAMEKLAAGEGGVNALPKGTRVRGPPQGRGAGPHLHSPTAYRLNAADRDQAEADRVQRSPLDSFAIPTSNALLGPASRLRKTDSVARLGNVPGPRRLSMAKLETKATVGSKVLGWGLSFCLATALLLFANVIAVLIDAAWVRWMFTSGALCALIVFRPLRALIAKAMVVALALATIGYVAANLGDIARGNVGLREAVPGVVRGLVDTGPARQLFGLLQARAAAKREALHRQPPTPPPGEESSSPQTFASHYDRYLYAVDPRNPAVNEVASRLTRGCAAGDHLCESSRLVRFVTDAVEYRSDPRGAGDYVKPPMQTYSSRAGDCEDKTVLLVSLLESVGVRTLMAFEPGHTFPLVCFSESLPEMISTSAGQAVSRGMDLQGYLAAPWSGSRVVQHAASAPRFGSGGRACYAVETTDEGSWIGSPAHVRLDGPAFDPIERRQAQVWPPLAVWE